MANVSYINLLQELELFSNNHLQVKRFGSDFAEQMENYATETEQYPILYVVPTSTIPLENTTNYNVTIYCWDIIQKDRANINTILSDTNLILCDLYKYFTDGNSPDYISILNTQTLTPMNNALLDYCAGWQMNITFEVDTYTHCEIPFNQLAS